MYLLGTQEAIDLLSKDQRRPVFAWLDKVRPGGDLFVSVISLGQAAHMVENLDAEHRPGWRRLLAEGRRKLSDAGSVIDVDLDVVAAWAGGLRGDPSLADMDPETGEAVALPEDDRLVIATAIARNYSLVTKSTPALERIAESTTLTIVEPV